METLEEKKRREEEERLARERAEKAKRDRLCPECSKKVTNHESVFCDGKYRSHCFRHLTMTARCSPPTSTTTAAVSSAKSAAVVPTVTRP